MARLLLVLVAIALTLGGGAGAHAADGADTPGADSPEHPQPSETPQTEHKPDRLHLKDGRVLEGWIAREAEDGSVLFEIAGSTQKLTLWFEADEIDHVERGLIPRGTTKIAFISLEGPVGPFISRDALARSIDVLDSLPEERRPDVVVFEIDSSAGILSQAEPIASLIHDRVEPRYRTVMWVRSAVGPAGLIGWAAPEICMKPNGRIGAITGEKRPAVLPVIELGDRISQWSGHPPEVMRAMQSPQTLSVTRGDDGTLQWFLNNQGQTLVSPADTLLSLTAQQATKWDIAVGLAARKKILATRLGLTAWVEVGHEADDVQRAWRQRQSKSRATLEQLLDLYNSSIDDVGHAWDRRARTEPIAEARQRLKRLIEWSDREPVLAESMGLTQAWIDAQRDMLRRIERGEPVQR